MKVRFFDPGKGYLKIKDEVDAKLQEVMAKGDLILRDEVEKFEEKLAEYVGTKYAVALNSGTDAIYLSIKSLNLRADARIAVPSHTFKSTCGAVITAGLTPVVHDMMDEVKDADAYIPVHIAGALSDLPKTDKPIIEDACQALGAVKNPDTYSQCWSFYPAKLLGSLGDGGAITTNDPVVWEYVKEARNHFKGDNRDFGINSRMDNIQAAFLNIKFKYFDQILERREQIADMYYKALGDVVIVPQNIYGRVWQDYIIRTGKRDELYEFLKNKGIETMKNEYPFSPQYPKPTIVKLYESETLRIPCNENLSDDEVKYVADTIQQFYSV
jgi:dTDP-4-amino-4,6-dideoxygalactose transaminase|tara:strand:- start:418 stop:1398 length:981 start_codon:yes stop_codon:yes gene_type:complete